MRQVAPGPSRDVGIGVEDRLDVRRPNVEAGIHGIGDQILHPLGLLHVRQVDDALHRRELAKARLLRPPVRAQIPHPLRGHGDEDLVRAAGHRPAFFLVEVVERLRVLAFPNVLGHDRDAVVEVVGEVAEDKARIGLGERDFSRVGVDGHRALYPNLHVGGKRQIRRIVLEHVDRKDQVVRGPRLPIAPLDPLADVDSNLGIVFVVLVSGGNPRDDVVGLRVVGVIEIQRLVLEVPTRLGDAGQQKRVKRVVVLDLPATVLQAGTIHDQGPAPWHVLVPLVPTADQQYTHQAQQQALHDIPPENYFCAAAEAENTSFRSPLSNTGDSACRKQATARSASGR